MIMASEALLVMDVQSVVVDRYAHPTDANHQPRSGSGITALAAIRSLYREGPHMRRSPDAAPRYIAEANAN